MRVARQKTRADGVIETDRDVLDWLKFAQSETPGVQLSPAELALMDQEMDRRIDEIVEARIRERQLKLKEANSIEPRMPEVDPSSENSR